MTHGDETTGLVVVFAPAIDVREFVVGLRDAIVDLAQDAPDIAGRAKHAGRQAAVTAIDFQ